MALPEPQNIPISFISGSDTKDDPKQLVPGKMLTLQNASFQSPKEIRKRDGFSALSASILGGGTVSSGVGISGYQNELVSLDGSSLYSYSSDVTKQVNRGTMIPTSLAVAPVIRNTHQQSQPDGAYQSNNGLQCFTYYDSGIGGIGYTVIDSTTGAQIVNNGTVSATGTKAKVLTLGNYFFIVYFDSSGGQFKYKTILNTTPNTISGATTITSDADAAALFDITIINSSAYIAYKVDSTHIGLYSFTTGLVQSAQLKIVTSSVTSYAISIVGDASFNVWVIYGRSASTTTVQVLGFVVNAALNATILASTLISSIVGSIGELSIGNITAIVSGTTATVYYEIDETAGYIGYTSTNTLTISGTAGTAAKLFFGIGLASKVFVNGGVNYFLGVYFGNNNTVTSGSLEPTYFLFNGSGSVIGKLAPGVAGGTFTGILPETVISGSSVFIPYLLKNSLTALNGHVFYRSGVQNATFSFLSTAPSKSVFGNNLLLSGAQLWMYDGANVVEHGFHLFPEGVNGGITAPTGSGAVGIGASTASVNQMQYCALYEWLDNQGQLHRSAPSVPITINLPIKSSTTPITDTGNTSINSATLSSIGSDPVAAGFVVGQVISGTGIPAGTYIVSIDSSTQITMSNPATATGTGITFTSYDVNTYVVHVPTLAPTLKSNVSIVLYRTENNGTIFYRVSSVSSLTYNDKTTSTVNFTDNVPDAVLVGNEQLYTTGGEVANIAAPAVSALTTFRNRSIYLSPENPFEWGFSKQVLNNVPVEFNSQEFVQNVDQRIGKVTAAGPLDDKLVVFGPNRKFYVVGEGPAPSGANNDFTDATFIAGTTGCTNPASVLEVPTGLIYQDPVKGIWLLDRSLQEQYIGADVEQFNSNTVTSAIKVPNANKVMFTLNNGTNLVYDYYVGQWETDIFANAAVDSTSFENDVAYIQSNGVIQQQTPGVFSDNGSVIPIYFKTGWLNLASVSGYQRAWELQILGTYISPHTLTVNIYTDYSVTRSQQVVIPVLSDPGLYQFRIHLKVQKCEAIQVELTESQTGTGTEGFRLTALEFRVGVKRGLNKLPAAASYG